MYIKQQFSVCLHYFISFVSSFVFPSVNVESECVSVCDFFLSSFFSFDIFFTIIFFALSQNLLFFTFITIYNFHFILFLLCFHLAILFFFCLFSYYAILLLLLFFETGHQNNWLLQNVFLPVALSAFIHELESVDFT